MNIGPLKSILRLRLGGHIVLNLCLAMTGVAQSTSSRDLTQISLEDLMHLEVTSVSRKEQPLSKVPGSIYVINQSDIRHSGATNVPDLLRMVPGVDVARVNANTWAITIRGFNYRYSGKVLVLVDGRTVYSPAFSGVYWDQQSMPLENIDRIEVIRGPGGTVWGANAMNGVINIITKRAEETQGLLLSTVTGNYDRAQAMIQYGSVAGPKLAWRAWARYAMNGNSPSLPGNAAVDDGHTSQAGFRSDWNLSPADKMTVQGDISGNSEQQTITTLQWTHLPDMFRFNDPVRVGAGNLMGRWNHVFANGSETTLQVYYDRFRRVDQAINVVTTGDADFQYHLHAGQRNDIVVGTDFRIADQVYSGGYEISFGSGHRRDKLVSTFIQDELALTDKLALTIGTKLEGNSYTGFEYEPSVQLAWSPVDRRTFWFSAAKAIEQPSWLYTETHLDVASVPLPGGNFGLIGINGNPLGASPRVFNYEVGYRAQVSPKLTVDSSLFVADYRRLPTLEPQTPYFTLSPAPPHLEIPSTYANLGKAVDYGVEVSARWTAAKWWRLSPGLSYLRMHLYEDPRSADTGFISSERESPRTQAQLRSEIKLRHDVEWDTSAYYVSSIIDATGTLGKVPAYTRVDTRIGKRLGEYAELSISGQNLLRAKHAEFLDGLQVTPLEAGRAVVARLTWRF
jgi:iron complex outermembrane recepter protein